MLNIKNATAQMRLARRLGKLSAEVHARTLRRIGHAYALAEQQRVKAEMTAPPSPEWQAMMNLLHSIEAEVEPILLEKRKAERECFDIMYQVEPECRTVRLAPVSAKVARPQPVGYEYTRAWWDEAEKRERAAKKAGLVEVE
jgi:hypothetical protein